MTRDEMLKGLLEQALDTMERETGLRKAWDDAEAALVNVRRNMGSQIAALEARLCQSLDAAKRLPLMESREIRSILEAPIAPCIEPESRLPDRCGVCGEVYVGDVVEASAEHRCALADEDDDLVAAVARIVELEKQRDALNHINAEQRELLSLRDLRILALTEGVREYERKLAELRAREKQLWGAVEAWEATERIGQPLTTPPAFIVRAILSKTP